MSNQLPSHLKLFQGLVSYSSVEITQETLKVATDITLRAPSISLTDTDFIEDFHIEVVIENGEFQDTNKDLFERLKIAASEVLGGKQAATKDLSFRIIRLEANARTLLVQFDDETKTDPLTRMPTGAKFMKVYGSYKTLIDETFLAVVEAIKDKHKFYAQYYDQVKGV